MYLPVVKAGAHDGRVLNVDLAVGKVLKAVLDGVVGEHAVPNHNHAALGEGGEEEEDGGGDAAEHGWLVLVLGGGAVWGWEEEEEA